MQTDSAASAKFEPIKIQYHYDLGDLQEAQPRCCGDGGEASELGC